MKYQAPNTPEMTKMEQEHMKTAQTLAEECVVLLENDGTLPMNKPGQIALYGSGARLTVKGGTGSGDVNSRMVVNFEQGLEQAGYQVTTKSWIDRFDAKRTKAIEDYHAWAKKEAAEKQIVEFIVSFYQPFQEPAPELITEDDIHNSNTDTAIYVISRNSGEGADRFDRPGDYRLFPEERENLKLLGEHYSKVIVVLNIGGVMDMSELKDIKGINAVILTAQLGNIGGHVLPEVLLGKVNPSGKLVDTWAKKYKDYPSSENFSHNNGNIDDEEYSEDIYVGYRYFDTFDVEPEYCFGYGLSYTTFEQKISNFAVNENQVMVQVELTNTGNTFSGKEVVQLYVSKPSKELEQPYQELITYQKSRELKPKETQTITLHFPIEACGSYCEEKASYVLEKGDYVVRVGNSSRDTRVAGCLTIPETKTLLECQNVLQPDRDFDKLSQNNHKTEPSSIGITMEEANAGKLEIHPETIGTQRVEYQKERILYTTEKKELLTISDVLAGKCTVEELTAQLSVEELAELCVGTARTEKMNEGDSELIVGNASYSVPGAAGDSTAMLFEERGIKNLIQADGPAGLRLQNHFKTTADGRILPGGEQMGDFVTPFDETKIPADAIDYYQYCTAIPIGWALAHSWNEEMVECAGDMVGEEMEIFQIDLWLAPAMNIHRNPLCGRNFEYYSEDPVISGKTAAAMTKGVQKHKGKGTTIKHFAVNNQEDNRYFSNAHVSERALREIYLKGFEIAVKESKPLSVMTSYNLINGIHAANNKDLIQHMLRDEWGFDGVVMTDWFTSQNMPAITGVDHTPIYPISASTGCVYAGNDLQMPGCSENVRDLVEAVKEDKELDGYKITLADLQYCAANVIRVAAKTV